MLQASPPTGQEASTRSFRFWVTRWCILHTFCLCWGKAVGHGSMTVHNISSNKSRALVFCACGWQLKHGDEHMHRKVALSRCVLVRQVHAPTLTIAAVQLCLVLSCLVLRLMHADYPPDA